MLNNHHDIGHINISFFGKYFFLLVIRSCLYQKQLNHHTNKSLVTPVAVPFNWRRFCEPNLELLHFKHISEPSIKQSVDGDLYALVSKAFLTVAIPLSLSILGYMFTISNETKIILSGILSEFNSSIIWSKWLVSLILVS